MDRKEALETLTQISVWLLRDRKPKGAAKILAVRSWLRDATKEDDDPTRYVKRPPSPNQLAFGETNATRDARQADAAADAIKEKR